MSGEPPDSLASKLRTSNRRPNEQLMAHTSLADSPAGHPSSYPRSHVRCDRLLDRWPHLIRSSRSTGSSSGTDAPQIGNGRSSSCMETSDQLGWAIHLYLHGATLCHLR